MVLPTTGPLSFTDIVVEFGGTVPHSMSEYYAKATGIPASGTIKFSDFYGKSNNPLPPTWTTGTTLASQPINQTFSRNLLATSDSPIIAYAITLSPGFGTLSGLLADKSVNLTGVKSSPGTFSWTITATDTENQSTARTFSMSFTSIAPTWNTGTNLGTYYTGSYYTFALSASSDSTVNYSMVSTGTGYGYISGGTNLTTYGVAASTYYETVRAFDQEGQSTDRSFSITFVAPAPPPTTLNINISGYWLESVETGFGYTIYINSFSSLTVGSTTTGYWTAGSSVGRQAFTITITGASSISTYFPDYGTVTATVSNSNGSTRGIPYSQVVSQDNGTFWFR